MRRAKPLVGFLVAAVVLLAGLLFGGFGHHHHKGSFQAAGSYSLKPGATTPPATNPPAPLPPVTVPPAPPPVTAPPTYPPPTPPPAPTTSLPPLIIGAYPYPQQLPPAPPPPPPPAPNPDPMTPQQAATLARIRQCESGGNYQENTGNGFYGAYQFTQSTWSSLGLPGRPDQEPPAMQDQAVLTLAARSGWGQWPVCGRGAG